MGQKGAWKLFGFGRKERKMKQIKTMAKKLLHTDKKSSWDFGAPLSTAVAMTGALVIIAIVMRSLYLMYIKPDHLTTA